MRKNERKKNNWKKNYNFSFMGNAVCSRFYFISESYEDHCFPYNFIQFVLKFEFVAIIICQFQVAILSFSSMGVFMKIPNLYLSPKHFTLFVAHISYYCYCFKLNTKLLCNTRCSLLTAINR